MMRRVHHLLEIDAKQFCLVQDSLPRWVEEELRRTPSVVVRRGVEMELGIPVGVRGAARNERWAAFCDPKFVKRVIAPQQLLRRTAPAFRVDAIAALRSLRVLAGRWSAIPYPWGPGGSVGFELASGCPTVTQTSDLDLLMRAPDPLDRASAKSLFDALSQAALDHNTRIDMQIQTLDGAFALAEYAHPGTRVMMRCADGPKLVVDPWQTSQAA